MKGDGILVLFEMLRSIAFEEKLVEGTPKFRKFVRTARAIFDEAAKLLDYEEWERLRFDPEFPWPGLPKRRSIHRRRTLFIKHGKRLRDKSLSVDDVRIALHFAKTQVGQMFRELALGLMAGEVEISRSCARNLLELQAGFRCIWTPTRRHVSTRWSKSVLDHGM